MEQLDFSSEGAGLELVHCNVETYMEESYSEEIKLPRITRKVALVASHGSPT